MLDSDLAELSGVETKRLNEQVKRNRERFPDGFCFQLTESEVPHLKSQLATSSEHGGRRKLPYAFTEQGVAMLSAVLRSDTAVQVSIQIMQAFVEMRRFLGTNAQVFQRLESVERRQIGFEASTEKKFEQVFQAMEVGQLPRQGIFYDGQVFDAHAFVSELVRSAKTSLVLIDNFIDDSVLALLAKRAEGVTVTLYTKTLSKTLALDVKKFHEQHPPVAVREFASAHDRFLIVDGTAIYHFGASLKDLGKKWFAFSKFDTGAVEMLGRLGGRG